MASHRKRLTRTRTFVRFRVIKIIFEFRNKSTRPQTVPVYRYNEKTYTSMRVRYRLARDVRTGVRPRPMGFIAQPARVFFFLFRRCTRRGAAVSRRLADRKLFGRAPALSLPRVANTATTPH